MKTLKQLLILTLTALVLNACKKGGTNMPPVMPEPITPAAFAQTNFGSATNRDFIGQTVDITNNPIANVTVKIGTVTAQTDANGIFVIKNAIVFENFAYITATKTGFINGSKALTPTLSTNNIKIMLLPATVTATVNTGAISNVSLTNGTKIIFDGNFKTDAGTAYNGAVSVIVNHLDPADANLNAKMPGMLFAQTTNGDAKILETYGMVNVQLKGTAGEKLQPTNTAQIEFPITAGQQATAPATIPLWHFDEVNGYWKEDGIATKSGNKYVGNVKHFSWWNVDALLDYVYLNIKVIDGNSNPLNNVRVSLVRGANQRDGFTNANGEVNGAVPKNETLTLNIYGPCSSIIHTQTIGALTANTTLPNIVINIPATQTTIIGGSLKKCDNTNVTNGYVSVNYGGRIYIGNISNGTFSVPVITCGTNNITIIGQDLDANKNTGTTSHTITYPNTNIGNILTCNTNIESIIYRIDNLAPRTLYANISANVIGNQFQIDANTPSQNDQITIIGDPLTPGTYSSTNTSYQLAGIGLSTTLGSTVTQQNITFTLTNVGATGQYIDVSFSGSYTEMTMVMMGNQMISSPIPHTISGTAHVIRDN